MNRKRRKQKATPCIRVRMLVAAPTFEDKNIGAVDRHAQMSKEERKYQTCVHEAGHAVAAYCLGGEVSGGGCWLDDDAEGEVRCGRLTVEELAVMTEAGDTAERIWLGHPSRMTCRDYEWWYNRGRKRRPGTKWSDASKRLRLAIKLRPNNIYGIMGAWNWKAQRMLKDPLVWASVIHVANALYQNESLSSLDIERRIVATVRRARKLGFKKSNVHNQGLHELVDNFRKILAWKRRDPSLSWMFDNLPNQPA